MGSTSADQGGRGVHFVGSFPAGSAEEAMRAMLDSAGPRLRTVPTGETHRYEFYVLPILDDLVEQGVLEVKKAGNWLSSRDRTIYRMPRGEGREMNLGYLDEARATLPLLHALRTEYKRPDLALQIGMPTDFTLAFIALGAAGMRRHRQAFTDATVREITAIRELAGDDVVIQLEATAELVLMARAQPVHRRVDATLGVGRAIAELAAAAPAGTRFGVHLCLGSLRNKSRATLRDAAPLVDLANSVVRQWPAQRTLEYLHGPFAAGDIPPSARPETYAPLADLRLPDGTRFYAGMVHDAPTEEQQLETLRAIEAALGRPVDGIATACGLGRRPREVADELMARTAALLAAALPAR